MTLTRVLPQPIGANAVPSYASGTTEVPLLGETIGDALRRTASRYADREALVDLVRDRGP